MNHSVIPIQERSDIFSSDTTTKGNHRWFLLHYLVISYARSIAILRGVVVPASGSPDDGSPCLVVTASSYTFQFQVGQTPGFRQLPSWFHNINMVVRVLSATLSLPRSRHHLVLALLWSCRPTAYQYFPDLLEDEGTEYFYERAHVVQTQFGFWLKHFATPWQWLYWCRMQPHRNLPSRYPWMNQERTLPLYWITQRIIP